MPWPMFPPPNLPVHFPTKYELVVNGLTVPPSLPTRAEEVIE
ncbi:MAG: hypothetical protein WBE93_08215 [Pseudolabrys sp.]